MRHVFRLASIELFSYNLLHMGVCMAVTVLMLPRLEDSHFASQLMTIRLKVLCHPSHGVRAYAGGHSHPAPHPGLHSRLQPTGPRMSPFTTRDEAMLISPEPLHRAVYTLLIGKY